MRGGHLTDPQREPLSSIHPRGVPCSLELAQRPGLLPAAGPVTSGNDKTSGGVSQINGGWGAVFQGEGAAGAKAWGHHLHLTVFRLQPEHPHSRQWAGL